MPLSSNPKHLSLYGLLVLLVVFEGCGSIAKEVRPEQLARIEIGKSTRDDVLRALGLPNKRELRRLEPGKTLEFWTYYKGRGRTTVHIVAPGGVLSRGISFSGGEIARFQLAQNEEIAALFVFDESGLVVDAGIRGN